MQKPFSSVVLFDSCFNNQATNENYFKLFVTSFNEIYFIDSEYNVIINPEWSDIANIIYNTNKVTPKKISTIDKIKSKLTNKFIRKLGPIYQIYYYQQFKKKNKLNLNKLFKSLPSNIEFIFCGINNVDQAYIAMITSITKQSIFNIFIDEFIKKSENMYQTYIEDKILLKKIIPKIRKIDHKYICSNSNLSFSLGRRYNISSEVLYPPFYIPKFDVTKMSLSKPMAIAYFGEVNANNIDSLLLIAKSMQQNNIKLRLHIYTKSSKYQCLDLSMQQHVFWFSYPEDTQKYNSILKEINMIIMPFVKEKIYLDQNSALSESTIYNLNFWGEINNKTLSMLDSDFINALKSHKPIILIPNTKTFIYNLINSYNAAHIVSTNSTEGINKSIATILSDHFYSQSLIDNAKILSNDFSQSLILKEFITILGNQTAVNKPKTNINKHFKEVSESIKTK